MDDAHAAMILAMREIGAESGLSLIVDGIPDATTDGTALPVSTSVPRADAGGRRTQPCRLHRPEADAGMDMDRGSARRRTALLENVVASGGRTVAYGDGFRMAGLPWIISLGFREV